MGKMVAHFLVDKDWDLGLPEPTYIDVMQIYIPPDKSVSYLFFYQIEAFGNVQVKRKMVCEDMAYTMPMVDFKKPKFLGEEGTMPARGVNMMIDEALYEYEENQEMFKEWVKNNKVPKNLEGRLLHPKTVRGSFDYSDRYW